MAMEKLDAVRKNNSTFVHRVEHDIESIEWVILYAVYQHSLSNRGVSGRLRTNLESEAGKFFATSSTEALYQQRLVALDDVDGSISGILHYASEVLRAPQLGNLLSYVASDLEYRYHVYKLERLERKPRTLPPVEHTDSELSGLPDRRPAKKPRLDEELNITWESRRAEFVGHKDLYRALMEMVKQCEASVE